MDVIELFDKLLVEDRATEEMLDASQLETELCLACTASASAFWVSPRRLRACRSFSPKDILSAPPSFSWFLMLSYHGTAGL